MDENRKSTTPAEEPAGGVPAPEDLYLSEVVVIPPVSHEAGEEEAGGPDIPAAAPAGPDLVRAASIAESLLLVSAKPLSLDGIGEIAGGLSRTEVQEVVRRLKAKYSPETSGILVEVVGKGVQLRTNPANQDHVRKLFDVKPPRFSRAALETLAIVAYKQPVTRLEMEQIRGVDCAASIKTLMERRLVKVVGKKNVPGKPFLFGTSREFLEVFGLASLSDLPSLRDIEDFLASSREKAEAAEGAAPILPGLEPAVPKSEFAESLLSADPGEPFVAPSPGVPATVSDDALAEAASLEAGLPEAGADETAAETGPDETRLLPK